MPQTFNLTALQVYSLTEILREIAYWGNREISVTMGDMFPDCATVRFNDGNRNCKFLISRSGRYREVIPDAAA